MSAECSTEHHTSQQSDKNFKQEQPNSQSTGSDVTAAANECETIHNQDTIHHEDYSQVSNATTITLSSPSQDASTGSQDLYTGTSKLPSVAEKMSNDGRYFPLCTGLCITPCKSIILS